MLSPEKRTLIRQTLHACIVEKLNNIVIKKSETNNNKDIKENGNEKVNKMKEVVSKDIKETSTGNRTYRDVCAIGK